MPFTKKQDAAINREKDPKRRKALTQAYRRQALSSAPKKSTAPSTAPSKKPPGASKSSGRRSPVPGPRSTLKHWKLGGNDAPSRVETIHSIISCTGDVAFTPGVSFTPSTLFVWRPDMNGASLAYYNEAGAGTWNVGGLGTNAWSDPNYYRPSNVPDPLAIVEATERTLLLSANLVIKCQFGANTGLLRIKRLTSEDTTRTITEMLNVLRSSAEGITEYTMGGNVHDISLASGLHSKLEVGNYSTARNTIVSYGAGSSLQGWVFAFTTLAMGTNSPPPTVRLFGETKLQHELNANNAYLKDHLTQIPLAALCDHLQATDKPKKEAGDADLKSKAGQGNELGSRR